MSTTILLLSVGLSISACMCIILSAIILGTLLYLDTSGRTHAGELGNAVAGPSGKATISFYGQSSADDNGQGFIGVDLFKHGKAGIKFKGRTVYPIAVHHDHAPKFLYKLMEIEGKGLKKKIVGHVVDICNRNDSPCKNKDEHGLNFLIDIHATAFKEVGMSDGLIPGTYKVIGELRPPAMPKNIWIKGAGTYVMCSCTGKCEGSSQKWVKVGACT